MYVFSLILTFLAGSTLILKDNLIFPYASTPQISHLSDSCHANWLPLCGRATHMSYCVEISGHYTGALVNRLGEDDGNDIPPADRYAGRGTAAVCIRPTTMFVMTSSRYSMEDNSLLYNDSYQKFDN